MFLPINLYSQNGDTISLKQKRNSVYIEVFGNGYVPSANYERILTDSFNELLNKPRLNHIAIRGGLGFVPYNDSYYFSLPFELLTIFGNNEHHFEIGLGPTLYPY